MSAKDAFAQAEKARKRRESINKPDAHGTNAFMSAIERGDVNSVSAMLQDGADVHFKSKGRGRISRLMVYVGYAEGSTPLHVACLMGAPSIVSMLLKNCANVDLKNNEGHTPLDYALLSYSYFKDKLEEKSSSRFTTRKSINKTAQQVARYEDVILQLLKHGAKTGLFEIPENLTWEHASRRHGLKPPQLP